MKKVSSFISLDYLNYTLAESKHVFCCRLWQIGLKKHVFSPRPIICRPTKKTQITKAPKSILYNIYLIHFVVRSIIIIKKILCLYPLKRRPYGGK